MSEYHGGMLAGFMIGAVVTYFLLNNYWQAYARKKSRNFQILIEEIGNIDNAQSDGILESARNRIEEES